MIGMLGAEPADQAVPAQTVDDSYNSYGKSSLTTIIPWFYSKLSVVDHHIGNDIYLGPSHLRDMEVYCTYTMTVASLDVGLDCHASSIGDGMKRLLGDLS